MIKIPITYSAASLKLLEDCEVDTLTSRDWMDEKYNDIKNEIKEYYKHAQNFTCPYCKQRFQIAHNATWDIEHIIPRDLKPMFMFQPQNLCISCKDCNGPKSNENVLKNKNRVTFPNKSRDYLIVHPHYHTYEEHIEVIVLGELYRALSDEGSFTIKTCDLLRFYKFTSRDPIVQREKLSTHLAKNIAFAASLEEQEKAEIMYLDYLKQKYEAKK